MVVLENDSVCLEIFGLGEDTRELSFKATCLLCGIVISERHYDTSDAGAGARAFADSTVDAADYLRHLAQHQGNL